MSDIKQFIKYEDAKRYMRDFDVVFFRGDDFVSGMIRATEKELVGRGEFSHCGIIVTKKTLPFLDLLEEGELYIFESVMSGSLNDGVLSIQGLALLGIQIRSLSALIRAMRRRSQVQIGWMEITDNPLDEMPRTELLGRMEHLYLETKGKPYPVNITKLLSALDTKLLVGKRKPATMLPSDFFCSQFVVYVLCQVGRLPLDLYPTDYTPADLLPGSKLDLGEEVYLIK